MAATHVEAHPRPLRLVRQRVVHALRAPEACQLAVLGLERRVVGTAGRALAVQRVGSADARERQPVVDLRRRVPVVNVSVRHAGCLATAGHVAAERRPPLEEETTRVGQLRQHNVAQQAQVLLVELGVGLPVLGRLAQPPLDPVRRRPAVAAAELAHVMRTAAPCFLRRGRRRLQALKKRLVLLDAARRTEAEAAEHDGQERMPLHVEVEDRLFTQR